MARVEEDLVLGGRYRLVRLIASGGMGTVWKAEDGVLHRQVAVKMLSDSLASDEAFVERFRREALAAARLSHPNVAGVFDYGEEDGTRFMVMELVRGETLAQRLDREGRLPPAEAARIAAEIAAALQEAHAFGIVHRDVKPGNVMVTPDGHVKVMDFGIAAGGGTSLTATGMTIGTAKYLSPEQARGDKATPASDIYALGVVLYEMLAGKPPFAGGDPLAVATAIVREEPPPLAAVAPDVPRALASACHAALSKDPSGRPKTAGEFAALLRSSTGSASDGPDAAHTAVLPAGAATEVLPEVAPAAGTSTPTPTTTPTPAPARPPGLPTDPRRRLWLLAAALAVIAVVAVALSSLGEPVVTPPPGQRGSPTAPPMTEVPAVLGLSLHDAALMLGDAGLEVARVEGSDVDFAVVVRSDPVAGTAVPVGTPVTLHLGIPSGSDEEGNGGEGGGDGKGKGKGKDEDKEKDKDND